MTDLITEARELCKKATPGPWETNVFYACAGVNDGTHKGWNPPPNILKGECAYCREAGSFVREYKDEKGQTRHIHRFTSDDWRTICNTAGDEIVGNYDYECGGICTSEADAMFIARSRTLIPELCDALEKAEAQIESIHKSLDFAETQRQRSKNYTELAINNGLALGRIAVILQHDFEPLHAVPEKEEHHEAD